MSLLSVSEFKALAQPRRSKYGVAPASERAYGGKTYMSKLECGYAQLLDTWKLAGAVKEWTGQVAFVLHAPGLLFSRKKPPVLGRYICDFKIVWETGRVEYVETKGFMTPLGKWKLAHCQAEYNLKITLVRKLPT
jgi:hypothetical protein